MISISNKKGTITRPTLAEALNAWESIHGRRGILYAAEVFEDPRFPGCTVQPWDAWSVRGTFATLEAMKGGVKC